MKYSILLQFLVLGVTCLILSSVSCKRPQEISSVKSEESHTKKSQSNVLGGHPEFQVQAKASNSKTKSKRYVQIDPKQYKGKLPFSEKAKIELEVDLPDKVLSHPALRGRTLSSLPVWQREKMREIRVQLHAIYSAADEAADKMKDKSIYERSQWMEKWNKEHRQELRALKSKERLALMQRQAPTPTEEEIEEFQQKLISDEPIFQESDIMIIEKILPPTQQMLDSNSVIVNQKQQLLSAHQILSEYFPQSVRRKDLKYAYRDQN